MGRRARVVVVEDETWVRTVIRELIEWERLGCEPPVEFDNAADAVAYCAAHVPELILLDIRMPGMSGLEFLQCYEKSFSQSRVIVVSGYDEFEYVQRALRAGAHDYILKPIDEDELIPTIKSALDTSKRIREEEKERHELRNRLRRAYTERVNKRTPHHSVSCPDPRLQQALEAIQTRFQEPLSAELLADEVGMSRAYFSELFSQELGITFGEQLTRTRIEVAKQLLDDTWMRVYEVSQAVGYPNPNYFARLFRERVGVLPSSYRSRSGKAQRRGEEHGSEESLPEESDNSYK